MSDQLTFLERLKRAHIVRVLIVYLGVSWVVLQLVGTLKDLLVLPDWLGPITLVLLGVGLVVTGATALVQSLDSTTRAEEAGEVPTDWEIAPADVIASLKSGRLPHLTWGRALLGGVVALSLAIGAAGGYVLLTGGSGLLGPTEAGAAGIAEGVAVLPFEVSGDEFEIYREGMVNLLSTSFDGVGGFRTISPRTVFARWREEVGEANSGDLDSSLRAAGRTGARYAILGSMVPAGGLVRVSADIYDLDGGSKVGAARFDGSADQILGMVDGLSVGIARELMGAEGERAATEKRLASITTSSLAALQDFLEGERLYRLGDFHAAMEPYQRAVATDSTFALAWAQLASAAAWASGDDSPQISADARAVAHRLESRLSPRVATLVQARVDLAAGEAEVIERLEEYVRRYPDDAEGWHILGDSRLHLGMEDFGSLYPSTRDEVVSALRRATELDPGFAPYYLHVVEFAFAAGDSTAAAEAITAYRANGGAQNVFSGSWDAGFGALFGDAAGRSAGIEAARELQPFAPIALGLVGLIFGIDEVPRELTLWRAMADDSGAEILLDPLVRAGRIREVMGLLDDAVPSIAADVRLGLRLNYGLGDAARTHQDALGSDCGGDPHLCLRFAIFKARHGALDGHADELAAALAEIPARVEAIVADAPPGAAGNLEKSVSSVVDDLPAWASLWAGDAQAAYDSWQARRGGGMDAFGAAQAGEAVGDYDFAERFYLASNWHKTSSEATYRLARMYDRLDRREDAVAQYRRLALRWSEADDDFQPWVEVQEALARLGG